MSSSIFEYNYWFKLQLVGDPGVGKSCLLLRFAENTYTENYISTIGVDFKIRSISIGKDDKTAKLQIWDCAGQGEFRSVSSKYSRGVHGIVLLFDLTDQVSFNNIKKHLEKIWPNAGSGVQIILVGTKSDLNKKRLIDYATAIEYAESLSQQYSPDCKYIETSAKDNHNVEELFFHFSEQIAQKKYPEFVASNSQKLVSASSGDVAIKANFTTKDFLVELDRTVEAMYTAIATNAFFKPTRPVYDALRTFQKTYSITAKSTPEQIITAMGELTRACPEICHEDSAEKLLQMTQQPIAKRCTIM